MMNFINNNKNVFVVAGIQQLVQLFPFPFLFLAAGGIISSCQPPPAPAKSTTSSNNYYNIVELGAVGDGKTDSSRPLLEAWSSACASPNPSTIHVPPAPAPFLLPHNLHFKGPCANKAITLRIQATFLPLQLLPNSNNTDNYWLLFQDVDGISIRGGTLDARGAALWACKNSSPAASTNCPIGTTVPIQFSSIQLFM